MKKTTSLLAALLLAGGMTAKLYPQTAAPASTPVPPAGQGANTTASVEAAIATKQLQSAQAQVELAESNVAQAQAALQDANQADATEAPAQGGRPAAGGQAGYAVNASGDQNPLGGGNFYTFEPYSFNSYGFNSAEQPRSALVIRTSETAPETLTAMKEDLNIMGRILEKALSKSTSDDDQARAMGIRLTGIVSGGGGAKYLQIEGSGALFLLNVDFPLLGPPEKAPAEKTTAATSSTWNEAKRELYGHTDGDSGPATGREEFDSKRVDRLKTSLLEALKNAANMSHLPAAETVTVVVNGGSPHGRGAWFGMGGGINSPISGSFGGGSGTVSWTGTAPGASGSTSGSATTSVGGGFGAAGGVGGFGGGGGGGAGGGGGGFGGGHASSSSGSATTNGPREKSSPRLGDRLNRIVRRGSGGSSAVMTIRVAKTDIDAFAAGKIDLDDFRKKATITVY